MNVRRGYELAGLFWGRPIRPFHLAVAIATGAIAVTNLVFDGVILTGVASRFVGFWASVATILLFVGWWWRNERVAEWGLLLATGVWVSRATFGILDYSGNWLGIALSIAWTIGASGAYLLERYDNETRVR